MDINPIALALQIVEEDEADYLRVILQLMQIAVNEIMEMEEGEGLGDIGQLWVRINVDINEYHTMGDPSFKLHFRMSRVVFEVLFQAIGNHLRQVGRLQRERTPIQDAVLMVVWLLATPDSFSSVALRFGVGPSTLYYFYTYVTEVLREMAPQFISWPDAAERQQIKHVFERATGFPGVIGSVDGTHVYITAPVENAAQYRNRFRTYSINVQAIVDNNLLVRHLHVGEVGSMHDARLFRRSGLQTEFLNNGAQLAAVDEHLVGDGAYVLTDYMMIPYANNGHLTAAQLHFNRSLSQSRVRVENSFARAKGKWRRLKFLHARNPQNVVDHITASYVLHNFSILEGEPMIDEEELAQPIYDDQILGNEEGDDDGNNFENDDNEGELLEAAQGRGIEKRTLILTDILPVPQ